MNQIGQYFEWHYLPFIISFLFSLIMFSISHLSGLSGHHGSGHTHGLHHHGIGHNLHHNLHHGAHNATSHGSAHGGSDKSMFGGISKVLSFIGVGSLPLTLLIFSAGLVWGLVGFIANLMLQSKIAAPALAFVLAVAIASTITLISTHILGRIFVWIIPPERDGARKEISLLGEIGTSQSTITEASGTVLLKSNNDTFRVKCRIHQGETEIPTGMRVQLIAYEPEENLFYGHIVPAEILPKQKIPLR